MSGFVREKENEGTRQSETGRLRKSEIHRDRESQ